MTYTVRLYIDNIQLNTMRNTQALLPLYIHKESDV